MSKFKKALFVGGLAAAAISMTATMALADPATTPDHNDIVGTGSDTTQFVIGQASADYDASHASASRQWYSFDAFPGSATITEKTGCAVRNRPVGSGGGIAELEANLRPSGDTTDYCVDYARSSRARQSTDPASILFIPFGIDGVTWAADALPGFPSNAPASLTTAQLTAIYSCNASLLNSSFPNAPVTWKELGGTSTHAVIPVIPQSTSGTRAFFLTKIGNPTLGSCVQGQDNTVEENEGINSIFTNSSTSRNIIFPYSIAVYLAQTVHGHNDQHGNMVLRKVNGISPTAGTGTSKKINSTFPYLREVYDVVRNKSTTGGQVIPTYLTPIFGNGTAKTGWLCANATAQNDIHSYGFLSDPKCGTIQ